MYAMGAEQASAHEPACPIHVRVQFSAYISTDRKETELISHTDNTSRNLTCMSERGTKRESAAAPHLQLAGSCRSCFEASSVWGRASRLRKISPSLIRTHNATRVRSSRLVRAASNANSRRRCEACSPASRTRPENSESCAASSSSGGPLSATRPSARKMTRS